MKIISLYHENKYLFEANLKQLASKTINETPKLASRGDSLKNSVRYYGLSKDGTLNFKIKSQTRPGKYHYAFIEAPDILKFGDIVEEGDHFNEADLNKLLTMNGFRLHCNDESFLYYAFQYIATMGNYEIEPETRAPKRNNVLLQGALCFTGDTEVLTSEGLKPIKDIKPGDYVYTHTGNLRKVTETSSHYASETVTIKSGTSKFTCTPNHPLYSYKYRRNAKVFDWVEAKDLTFSSDRLVTPKLKHNKTEDITPDMAFLLGLYLADGTARLKYCNNPIHTSKYPIIDRTKVFKHIQIFIDKRFKNVYLTKFNSMGISYTYFENEDTNNGYISINDPSIINSIYKLGGLNHKGKYINYTKSLPEESLGWSSEIQKELLLGFFWGDGSINFHHGYPQITISNTNYQIMSTFLRMFLHYNPQWDYFDRTKTNICANPMKMAILRFNGPIVKELFDLEPLTPQIKWQSLKWQTSLNVPIKYSLRPNKLIVDGYTTHLIYSIEKSGPALVYNIGVDIDESYLITKNCFAAHNCKHLLAVVKNLYENKSMRQQLVKDIDNYLRMIVGLDYEDYQQLNQAKQIQQQNRAVKWKNKPSDYMNDYFARKAKNHSFLDDHDIKKSLKKEMNKFLTANPDSSVDDFLRSYFQMTQKAFADDMKIPEDAVEDYFNELGFSEKKDKIQEKRNNQLNNQTSNKGLDAGILTKDSENLIKESADLSRLSYTPEERQNVINKTESNMASHRLSDYIEFVDIDYVDKIKEYDREEVPSHSDDELSKLFNQVKENGITEPLMICFNPYTGDIYLGEGNHRLMFAKLLKLEEVPCYCVRNEWFSLGKHSINPDNITPIQDSKDLGRYYANPMRPSMLGEPFGPNYDGHLLKESYVYANEVTNKELNSNPVKFVTYGNERHEIEFNNLSDLFKYINQCGGFNSFKGIRWSIMSEYKGSEFYLVRNSYARGGWIWEDVNGSRVSYEPRSFRTKSINESENEKQYLDPQEAHIKYQEYLKGHINNVKDAIKLIIDKCSDNEFIQGEKETLLNIAEHHDESKFAKEEYMPYLHHFYPTCPEDENLSEEFEMACRHHILSNKHHWDFWIDPKTLELRDIPDNDRQYKLYCVERVADWLAMAKQHDEDKSIWYEYNRNAIKMPDWAFEFIDYIYSKVPDDFYLNLHFGGTRGPLDESNKHNIKMEGDKSMNLYQSIKLKESNSKIYGFEKFPDDEIYVNNYFQPAIEHAFNSLNGLRDYFNGLVNAVKDSPMDYQGITNMNDLERIPKLLNEIIEIMNNDQLI